MKNLLFILIVLLGLQIQAQNSFFKTYSNTSFDSVGFLAEETGKCVRQLSNGNYFLLGITGDNLMLNEIDNSGDLLSSKTISYDGHQLWGEKFIEASNEDILIVGSAYNLTTLTHKTIAIRYDISGNLIWAKEYDGPIPFSIIELSSGNFAIAGQAMGLFIIDGDGNVISSYGVRYFSGVYNGIEDMTTTLDGGIIMSGGPIGQIGSYDATLIKTDVDGNLEWQKFYGGLNNDWGGAGVLQTPDEGFLISGSTNSFGNTPAGNTDFYLIKTDFEGNIEWSKTYGTNSEDMARGAVLTDDGGFAVVGWTEGELDLFDAVIFKVDSQGDLIWANAYNHLEMDGASFIDLTSDGGFVFTGGGINAMPAPTDNYIFKTNELGIISEECHTNLSLIVNNASTQLMNVDYYYDLTISSQEIYPQINNISVEEIIICQEDSIIHNNDSTWSCFTSGCQWTGSNGQYTNLSDCEAECHTSSITNQNKENKKIKKTINILGQESPIKTNKIKFYIYNDGSVEKRIILE